MELTKPTTSTYEGSKSNLESSLSSVSVSAIEGEPAIVINGAPPPSMCFAFDCSLDLTNTDGDSKSADATTVKDVKGAGSRHMVGETLKGQKVKKRFGRKSYMGEVTAYDPETRWYHVLYEDDDEEDLEWVELEEILLLDTHAIIKKNQGVSETQKKAKAL
ncbi:hypothetical protein O6H91_16G036900 [Diphasiastrum complanatum]|uniref:Uncharacterized protein n=1 Tax=Diphasiastrum complanatum TaxID=34168 RepID=A0ACC2BBF9_DIPCM|nr:hypothetical protein O6H91_16G036900 [Diphasiastrum complanatum]